MKTHTIYLAILVILLCPVAFAQLEQPGAFRDPRVSHLTTMGTNIPPGTPREFLPGLAQHSLLAGSKSETGTFVPNGLRTNFGPTRKISSPQSQISVIDTAIVLSTVDTTRHVYSFNAKARMTADVTQKLRGGLWVDTLRWTWTFDANGNNLSFLREYWSNGQWVNDYRYAYTYDANRNMLTLLGEEWLNGQWVSDVLATYTYDTSGNRLFALFEQGTGGHLVNTVRYTYAYDANGNMLSSLDENWSNGQWVNFRRDTYTPDAKGKMLTDLLEAWLNGQWVNGWRGTVTYDVNENMLSWFDESWSNGQWMNNQRATYTYDANGNISTLLFESGSGGQWVIGWRVTYTYDAGNKTLSQLSETWTNGQWVNGFRNTYTYDAQENLTSVWYYTWLNSSWTPMDNYVGDLTDSTGNTYPLLGPGYNFNFIRRLAVTGVASPSVSVPASYSLSQNYPNPFNPSTIIRYSLPHRSHVTLTVFNTLGQKIAELVNADIDAGYHEVQFNASNLASGVYFYRIQAGSYVDVKKLLLMK